MASAAPSLRAVMRGSTASDMPCLLRSPIRTDSACGPRRNGHGSHRAQDNCHALARRVSGPSRHVRLGYKLGSDESALRGPSAFFRSAQGLIVAMDPLMPWSPLPVTEPLEHCLQLVQVESLSAPFEV